MQLSLAILDLDVPVLHVLRFIRKDLDRLIDDINATGYGLTFGLHSRLDGTIAQVTKRIAAGNVYVNRNVIGAVVGVQPFGGHGLSGTGPKAGGPLYLGRLVQEPIELSQAASLDVVLEEFIAWLEAEGASQAAVVARLIGEASPLGLECELPGPVGERNRYALRSRGLVLLQATTREGLFAQMATVLATGNCGHVNEIGLPERLPQAVKARFAPAQGARYSAILVEDIADVPRMVGRAAAIPAAIIPVYAADPLREVPYPLDFLFEEVAISINTTAAGGNVSLMMVT